MYPECVTRSKSGRGDAPGGACWERAWAFASPCTAAGLGANFGSSRGDILELAPRSVPPPVDLERYDTSSLGPASKTDGGRLGDFSVTELEKSPKKSSSSATTADGAVRGCCCGCC